LHNTFSKTILVTQKQKNCNVCVKIIIRQSVLVSINNNNHKNYGFAKLSKAIQEGMPSNKSTCCDQLMQKHIKYGTQIFIKHDPVEYNTQKEYRLAEFST